MAGGEEQYAHLFDGVRAREVTLRLLEETYEQARATIAAQGWDADWGDDAYLVIFAHGLARVRDALRQARAGVAAKPTDELGRLRGEWMASEAQYAVMKFRAYTLTEENKRLKWSLTACERQLALAERRLALFREEARALKAALAARDQAAPIDGGAAAPTAEPTIATRPGQNGRADHWLRRVWRRLTAGEA